MSGNSREDHPKLTDALREYIEQRRKPLRRILEHAIASGDMPKPADMDLVIDAIMGPIVLRMFHGNGDVSAQATRSLMELIVAGTAATAPVPSKSSPVRPPA